MIDITELPSKDQEGKFKYGEGETLDEIKSYIIATYGEHYANGVQNLQAFDAFIEMDEKEAWRFFRNCAIKYLWRFGKKDGFNRKDMLKAAHYLTLVLCLTKDRK